MDRWEIHVCTLGHDGELSEQAERLAAEGWEPFAVNTAVYRLQHDDPLTHHPMMYFRRRTPEPPRG